MTLRVDPKLARGLTMAEVRPVLRAPAGSASGSLREAAHPARKAFKALAYRYQTSRAPDPGYVASMSRIVDALFAADPGTFARDCEDLPSTGGHPWFARSFLSMAPASQDPDCRSLVATATSFLVDDRQVSMSQARVMEVGLHVVERFHQRTRGGLLRDALATIGRAVLDDMAMVAMMLEADGHRLGATLAIPFADGLILGEAQVLPARACAPYAVVQYPGGRPVVMEDKAVITVERDVRGDWRGKPGLGFRAATFIGPGEMYPRQERLRDSLVGIGRRHGPIMRHLGEFITSPGKITADTLKAQGDITAAMKAAYADLRAVLADPEMRDALSRTRGASSENPWPTSSKMNPADFE